jgi:hypothetical protein
MSQSVKIERKLMALEGLHRPKSINKPLVGNKNAYFVLLFLNSSLEIRVARHIRQALKMR